MFEHNPHSRFARLILAFGLLLFAAGCSQTTSGGGSAQASSYAADALPNCCARPEQYPQAVVELADGIAPLLGWTISRVVWRKGHLLAQPDAAKEIEGRLRPLDVIAVSNKGRMSGHTIPGLFGHVALYVGTEAELRAAGLWDHSAVRAHRREINSGARFIEADQAGVHLSSAGYALDADAIAILRPRGLSERRRREALTEAFGRLGMPFDFHFDLDTPDCTFCTELVNTLMPELRLPVRDVYGRKLILPDEVVASAVAGRSGLRLVGYARADREGWRMLGAREVKRDLEASWTRQEARPSPAREDR